MAVYRYKHEWCGFDQDIFLDGVEKESVVVPCYRCGRDVSARIVRDKSAIIGRAQDGTVGIKRRNEQSKQIRRSGQK